MPSLFPIHTIPLRMWRVLTRHLARYTLAAGARSDYWALIHYAIFHRAFVREQRSFLAGRTSYTHSVGADCYPIALLRRNIHRLEKGLLMRPRRVPFALDYIAETVDAFTAVRQSAENSDPAELEWANDVLDEYFSANIEAADLAPYRRSFESKKLASDPQREKRVPYRRDLGSPPAVSFEAFTSLAWRRRSVRWFLPKSVDRRLLDMALEVGAQAPSACNRQPFQFRFFDDPDLVKEVIEIPYGLAGYGHQVPVVAVVVGQQRNFFDERDRHLIYIDSSLAVMGFLFALETLGLASCCINWPDLEDNERRMAALLSLAQDERPIMLIAIGYPDPDGMVAASTKKCMSRLRTYNFS